MALFDSPHYEFLSTAVKSISRTVLEKLVLL